MTVALTDLLAASSPFVLGLIAARNTVRGRKEESRLQDASNRINEAKAQAERELAAATYQQSVLKDALDAQRSISDQHRADAKQASEDRDRAESRYSESQEVLHKERRRWREERTFLADCIRNEAIRSAALEGDDLTEIMNQTDPDAPGGPRELNA